MILCSYKPETLTVRAGINLPTSGSSPNLRYYKPHAPGSVEPYDSIDDSINDINSPRVDARIADQASRMFICKVHLYEYV